MAMTYAVNCHLLFKEHPLFERAAAAKDAGFDYVEYWWPFSVAVPSNAEVRVFIDAMKASGTQLVGLNFFAGNMLGGDRGLVSWTERSTEFRANVSIALRIGAELGCKAFNALYGNRRKEEVSTSSDATGLRNLKYAASAAREIGANVLLEPVSGSPGYPLKTAADCFEVIDRLEAHGVRNVKFLCDLYHLAANGDDVAGVVQRYADRTGHVQIADFPGRGEPGTGSLPLGDLLGGLRAGGYDGHVALEYNPTVATDASFGALPDLSTAVSLDDASPA